MPRLTVGTENSAEIQIHYEDHGSGRPVVLIHGYPLDGHSWERQKRALLGAGYRAISYDRRGFGRSSQPTAGYHYDTLAADLNALLDHLELGRRRAGRVLDGDGGGDALPGALRLRPGALCRAARRDPAVPPQDRRQPRGRRREGVRGLDNFYNVDQLAPERISEQAWQASFNVASAASPYATFVCVDAWLTDFRDDLPKFDVPTLAVHGTEDPILPIAATAERLPGLIEDLRLIRLEGGPHNIGWTYPDEVNKALLEFLYEIDRQLNSVVLTFRE